MSYDRPLVDADYLLEKFPGKGGWTFARIPEIPQDKHNPFGWVTVRGFIDDYELIHHKLMPMGDSSLFLPVKSTVRKKIGKEAGDTVRVVLYHDRSPLPIPTEITACFENEPKSTYETFLSLTDGQKKAYLDWIYEAKKDETRANRIVAMMDRLEKGLKLHDDENADYE